MRNRIPFSSKKLRPPRKKPDNPFGYFLVIALIVTSLYVIFSQKTDDSESFQNAKEVPISTVQKQYQAEQLIDILALTLASFDNCWGLIQFLFVLPQSLGRDITGTYFEVL